MATKLQTRKRRQVTNRPTPRVASLLPGLTEVLLDLGFPDSLVASSHECDTQSTSNAAVTSPKLPPSPAPNCAEIAAGWNVATAWDAPVNHMKDVLSARVCSFYHVDAERLAQTAPHVLLTHLAKPRRVTDPDEHELCEALKRFIPGLHTVISPSCQTLRDIFELYHATARALGDPAAAVDVVAAARTRLHAITAFVSGVAQASRRRLAVVQWADPLFLAGDWVPQVTVLAGSAPNGVTAVGGPSVCVVPGKLLEMDVVVFAICAVDLAGCQCIVGDFWREHSEVFRDWRGSFVLTDATRLYSRPSLSTVILSAEVTADVVLGTNRFGHRGVLWTEWKPPS